MAFEKISNISLTDLFVAQIEGKILSGELSVGDKLPSARELTTLIGVSRPVISAGLIELEKMGFVEIKPRQGAYVCDYRRCHAKKRSSISATGSSFFRMSLYGINYRKCVG